MQTRKNDELYESMTGEFGDLSERLGTQLESGEVDSGTIANLPKQGREVKINGLIFEVQQITKSGNVVLELKGK